MNIISINNDKTTTAQIQNWIKDDYFFDYKVHPISLTNIQDIKNIDNNAFCIILLGLNTSYSQSLKLINEINHHLTRFLLIAVMKESKQYDKRHHQYSGIYGYLEAPLRQDIFSKQMEKYIQILLFLNLDD